MLKASSLIYTITIVFLTGILASSFLLYTQLSQKETDLYLIQYRLNKNVRSGIEYLLAASEFINYNEKKIVPLSDHPSDSIEVMIKPWGIFEIGYSKSFFKNKQSELFCLIGSKMTGNDKNGLYVADLDRKISICGKSRLDGITYLPTEGIERAYIEGQNYNGNKLVYGTQRISQREIPELETEFITECLNRIKGKTDYTDSVISWSEIQNDTLIHSFREKTILIQNRGTLILKNGYFKGNIILFSSSKIEIKNGCRLEGVILCAPEIFIENKDSSFFQAFASDTLILKEESFLLYPSVLGIIKDEQKTDNEPVLKLEKESRMAGSILVYELKPDHKHYPYLKMEENAIVYGEVYCNGLAHLEGSVFGTAIVFKLRLKTPSSEYENHLLNTTIDGTKVPPGFCGITLKDKRYHKTLLQWL